LGRRLQVLKGFFFRERHKKTKYLEDEGRKNPINKAEIVNFKPH